MLVNSSLTLKDFIMSKGLGIMQREIMDSLEASRFWMSEVESCDVLGMKLIFGRYKYHIPSEDNPFLVRVNGEQVYLTEEMFDLSAVLGYLAEKHGKLEQGVHRQDVSASFNASFWRAARRLIECGYLLRDGYAGNRIVVRSLSVSEQFANT